MSTRHQEPRGSAWVLAARPATLPVGVVPVAVGAAAAHAAGTLRPAPVALALACSVLLQVGTNLANDVFDADKGADGPDRLGPIRATQSGLLSARAVRLATLAVFALAAVLGGVLAALAGWPIIAIGVASVAAGIAYTGGPWPLGYHGLGDVFVLAFYGFVAVAGTAFAAAGHVPALAWGLALPVGALATAVLVINNLRDRATDARAGKRTLAVRFGRRFTVVEYAALVAIALATPVALVALDLAPLTALLSLAVAPWAIALVRAVARSEGRALNPLLGRTARLLVAHGLLLSVGVVA